MARPAGTGVAPGPALTLGLVAASALLLAPFPARAADECGAVSSSATTASCTSAAYSDGIFYNTVGHAITLNLLGSATPTTVTIGSTQAVGVSVGTNSAGGDITVTVGGETSGTAHAVTIAQGTNSLSGAWQNHGVLVRQVASAATTTVDLKSGVTIGAPAAPVKNAGVYARLFRGSGPGDGYSAVRGGAAVTSAATIHARTQGIMVKRDNSAGTLEATTITNTGAINSGVGNADAASGLSEFGLPGLFFHPSDPRLDELPHGINLIYDQPPRTFLLSGRYYTGGAAITNSGDITMTGAYTGIRAKYQGYGDVSITNSGDITAPRGDTGIFLFRRYESTISTVSEVRNSGDIAVANVGIRISSYGNGAITLVNSGAITVTAAAVQYTGIGSGLYVSEASFGDSDTTITNSGAITATNHAIYLNKNGVTGGITVTNTAALVSSAFDGIHVLANPTSAAAVVSNSGRITAKGNGIALYRSSSDGDLTVINSGPIDSTHDAGIRISSFGDADLVLDNRGSVTSTASEPIYPLRQLFGLGPDDVNVLNRGSGALVARSEGGGDVTVTNRGALVSKHDAGISVSIARYLSDRMFPTPPTILEPLFQVDTSDSKIVIDQRGAISGRKGVYARFALSSESRDERAAAAQPLIDVAWTGTFKRRTETAANDDDRFTASHAASLLGIDQEAAAGKAVREYGAPAGIEAQVISWRQAMREVAKSDDPGAFADNAAQIAAVPTGATAADNAYVAQFRAALENGEIEVASAVLTAIDSTATSVDDISDAEIVAYLRTDDYDTRTLLRNVLAWGLSDEEKAVLRAVATNTGVDAALTAAGAMDDAADDDDYWSRVKALLDRYNVGNIRVRMTAGSITALRGDGIRAYYATPHDDNGSIEVLVAKGAEVTGAVAGVYVANAGMGDDNVLKQSVTVDGLVTGGTDAAVHLSGGGRLTVSERGRVIAGSSGRAILVNDPGPAIIHVAGTVQGGAGAPAVQLTGGGSVTGSRVTVGQTGSITGKIGMQLPAGSTVEHYGTIRSTDGENGILIDFEGTGASVVNMYAGSIANGIIQLDGEGGDVVDASDAYMGDVVLRVENDGNAVDLGANFQEAARERPDETMVIKEPTRRRPGETMVMGPTGMMGINTSVFALTDDVLSDLTGSIHGAIVETQTGLRPGAASAGGQVVWATPFGGARDQNGDGTVAGATHYFGGGLVGTSWGVQAIRVGGFLGGSVGQLDVGTNQDGQATNVDMQTIFGGLVASRTLGTVLYDARLLVGHMTHDSTRRVTGDTAEVEYTSLFFSPEVGVATTMKLTDTLDALPRLRVRYAGLFTEGFRERAGIWDLQVEKRTLHVVEGRAEVGVPVALENGGRIYPRVGMEGRWLLAGSKIKGTALGDMPFSREAGGDDAVVTGTVGVGVSVPVAEATTLVGSFDGALTTEEAWRAMGYLGLTYSF